MSRSTVRPAHRARLGATAVAPTAALVLAALLWGLATTGTKFALRGFDPITLLTVELLAATVVLWAVLLVRGYRPPPNWRVVTVLGLLEPALAYLADTIGIERTSASNAAVLMGLESGFVVVLAVVLLREHANRALCLAVVVGVLGLAALEHDSWLTGPGLGDALVLLGALSAALYTIVARRVDPEADALSLTTHQFTVASAAIVPIAMVGWSSGHLAVPTHVEARFWLVAALIGVGGFGLSFVLYNQAIATVRAGSAALIINLIPAFGFGSAVLLLGEQVTPARLVGAALITASAAAFVYTEPTAVAAPGSPPEPVTALRVDRPPPAASVTITADDALRDLVLSLQKGPT